MFGNKAFHDHENKPARTRLRGLAGNPAIPGDLLRRLVDEQFEEIRWNLRDRAAWTDDQVGVLIDHPDDAVRAVLAGAHHLPPAHRARLVEDPAERVLDALAERPYVRLWTDDPEPRMPVWAFERAIERVPALADRLAGNPWVPRELRDRLRASRPDPAGSSPPPPTRADAEAAIDYVVRPGTRLLPLDWVRLSENPDVQLGHLAESPDPRLRALAHLDPDVPAEVVERLSHDPVRFVRAWVAGDGRLSPGRVRELFGDPDLTGRAAANPGLPVPLMRRILDEDGRELANERPPEGRAIALGAWTPETLPFQDE